MSKNNEKRRNEILKKLEQQPSLRIKELAESFKSQPRPCVKIFLY